MEENVLEPDQSDIPWIAAFDHHRFVLAGIKPLTNTVVGFSLEDIALKVLMKYAIQAGFYWSPKVFNYSNNNDNFIHIPNLQ
ncbi:MAG: hypothetical protein ACRER2_12265 [Methylococcales bacterium]